MCERVVFYYSFTTPDYFKRRYYRVCLVPQAFPVIFKSSNYAIQQRILKKKQIQKTNSRRPIQDTCLSTGDQPLVLKP